MTLSNDILTILDKQFRLLKIFQESNDLHIIILSFDQLLLHILWQI